MKKMVKVQLPRNSGPEDLYLFKDSLKYKLAPLKVRSLHNAFVTYNGYCLTKSGLVRESHHAYPEQYDHYLTETLRSYLFAKNNPESLIYLDSPEKYLLIHHPWFNYYHWMTEVIPRLWMVRDLSFDMVLILPDYYRKVDFIMSSLDPFSFKEIFFIPKGKSLFVRKLCMPQIKPICASHDTLIVQSLKKLYVNYVQFVKKIDIDLGDRIYVSRQKASKRKIVNEDEIFGVLKKFDFTIINSEDYTFFEQVSIFSNAKLLISIHGAGLTNMLFMNDNSSVLEMHKKITNENDHYSLTLWYLADALGYSYYHQICDPTDYKADYYSVDFIVDVQKLEENIKKMLI